MAERTRRRDGQAGVTLVELLVVMVLMGIVGALVLTSSVATHRAASVTSARLTSIGHARIAVNAITKSVRTAVRPSSTASLLQEATPRRLAYLAKVPGEQVPERVVISVVDGELVLDRWTADAGSGPDWTFPGDPRRRPLLADVPDDLAVFTYRDLDRCAIGAVCPPLAAGASGDLSRADRNSVDVVELAVASEATNVDPFEVATTIVLRNQGFVPEAGR